MRHVSDKRCGQNKKNYVKKLPPPLKIVLCMRYVKIYGTAGQATDDNVMRHMRVAW